MSTHDVFLMVGSGWIFLAIVGAVFLSVLTGALFALIGVAFIGYWFSRRELSASSPRKRTAGRGAQAGD